MKCAMKKFRIKLYDENMKLWTGTKISLHSIYFYLYQSISKARNYYDLVYLFYRVMIKNIYKLFLRVNPIKWWTQSCPIQVFAIIQYLAFQVFTQEYTNVVSSQIFVWCGKDWYFISILNLKCLRSIVWMICTGFIYTEV